MGREGQEDGGVKARAAIAETVTTMLAVVLTVVSSLLLDPEPGATVLGGMLALTLSRSQLERDRRGRVEAAIALPVIGLLAAAVGLLLITAPIVGAAAYTVGLTASVLIRRFGPVWRRLGSLLALPFTALLVAPVTIARSGPLAPVGWLLPILVPLLAFGWVTLTQLGAQAVHVPLSSPERAATAGRPPRRDRHGRLPSDKTAIQLAIALVLAFAVGYLLLPGHWAWIVLTVVVVLFGNRGRVDALIKAVGRLAGALAGSVLAIGASAAILAARAELPGPGPLPPPAAIALVAALLLVVAVGVLLRRYAYLWWVLCITVALAVVQLVAGEDVEVTGGYLVERLLAILIGAAIAVAVSWLVLPIGRTQRLPHGLRAWLAAFIEP